MVAPSPVANNKVTQAEALQVQIAALLQVVMNNQQLRAMGLPKVPIPSTLLPITQASVMVPTTQAQPITINDSRRPSRQMDRARSMGHGDRQANKSVQEGSCTRQIRQDEVVSRQLTNQLPSTSRISVKDTMGKPNPVPERWRRERSHEGESDSRPHKRHSENARDISRRASRLKSPPSGATMSCSHTSKKGRSPNRKSEETRRTKVVTSRQSKTEEMKDLRKRLDAIEAEKAKDAGTAVRFRPFTTWIRDSTPNPNLMYPTFRRYEGKTNAHDYLSNVEMTHRC